MINTVRQFIEQHRLLSPGKQYLVALSGGADSVALLRILLDLGYNVEAAHCNFHLRGVESDRDEDFCKQLCQKLGVELHIAHFDTKTYASLHKVSIEMAARELRYNYFRQLLSDLQLEDVCVAHHRDDSVETVLLNLLRGTGIEGLKGIAPRNGHIVRPLLCLSKEEILQYLKTGSQEFITDSSNLIPDVKRNILRLKILPLLKEMNPSVVENIDHSSRYVAEALKIFRKGISESISRCQVSSPTDISVIDIAKLKGEESPVTVLWYLLKDKDFSSQQVEQIATSLDAESGRHWESSTHVVLKDRGTLIIAKSQAEQFRPLVIPETGTYIIDSERKLRITNEEIGNVHFDRTNSRIYIDADKTAFPLTLRTARQGDWFIPFGMTGRKLLSDFLTDSKANILEKSQQLILTDANGDIIWLPHRRTDNRFCLTPETTRILKVEIEVRQ